MAELIFIASAIWNGNPKIRNQKHTNRVHIIVIHICIHTHNNSNTQTHGKTHTRDTTERERSQEEKRVWEREKKRFWPMMADGEVRTVAVAIDSRSGSGVNGRRRWRHGVESDREWGFVLRVRCWEWSIWAWWWEWAESFFNLGFFWLLRGS